MHSGKSNEKYYATLSRKRIVAAVVTFFEGKLLIVKPTYQESWLVPGGVVEAHESPLEAAQREFEEEIGFPIEIERLLSVDYARSEQPFKDEALHFLFRARDLSAADVSKIRLPVDELSSYELISVKDALARLGPLGKRLETALANDRNCSYSELGNKALK